MIMFCPTHGVFDVGMKLCPCLKEMFQQELDELRWT